MSDLYERLLAAIKAIDWAVRLAGLPTEPLGSPDATTLADALRAVLELHKPREMSCPTAAFAGTGEFECAACRVEWSRCETVRAVARALDIEIGDHQ